MRILTARRIQTFFWFSAQGTLAGESNLSGVPGPSGPGLRAQPTKSAFPHRSCLAYIGRPNPYERVGENQATGFLCWLTGFGLPAPGVETEAKKFAQSDFVRLLQPCRRNTQDRPGLRPLEPRKRTLRRVGKRKPLGVVCSFLTRDGQRVAQHESAGARKSRSVGAWGRRASLQRREHVTRQGRWPPSTAAMPRAKIAAMPPKRPASSKT
jgi:hypothetical protein